MRIPKVSLILLTACLLSPLQAQNDLVRRLGQRRGTPGVAEFQLDVAAQVFGLARDHLEQVSVSVEPFPHTGVTLIKLKAVDSRTGRILIAGVDQNLAPVDPKALMGQWSKVLVDHPEVKWRGSLAKAMHYQPGLQHPIAIWLNFPGASYDDFEATVYAGIDWATVTREQVHESEQLIEQFVTETNGHVVSTFRQTLQAMGLSATSWSSSAPIVFLSANAVEARAIAALPGVDAVFLQNFDGGETNASANATHRTHRLHQMGVRGREVALTILERLTIDSAHPDLLVADHFQGPAAFGAPAVGPHVTAVAGMAAGHVFMNEGAAPDVDLQNANSGSYSDVALVCAGDWVVFGPGGTFCSGGGASCVGCPTVPGPTLSTDVTSMSYYVSTTDPELALMDRYFEYQVRYFNDAYVAAAGNRGVANGNAGPGDGDGEIVSPAKAWNVITVGVSADRKVRRSPLEKCGTQDKPTPPGPVSSRR
ncbi:MAG: hypothetical protein CMJ84_17755 [Planctomycetes bacterium]|nr:hypothetical protein [Planctomycetota bacterium]